MKAFVLCGKETESLQCLWRDKEQSERESTRVGKESLCAINGSVLAVFLFFLNEREIDLDHRFIFFSIVFFVFVRASLTLLLSLLLLSLPMSSQPPPKQPQQSQQQPPRPFTASAAGGGRPPNPRVVLEPTTKLLPSWALAGLLAAFAGATYFYSARSVSVSELSAELEREAQRQAKLEEE